MFLEPEHAYDTKQLRERGWTKAMIRDLLGDPDDKLSVGLPYYSSSKHLFRQDRVEAIEASHEFREAFRRSACRRKMDPTETLNRSRHLEEAGAPRRYALNLKAEEEERERDRKKWEDDRKRAEAERERRQQQDDLLRQRMGIDPFGKIPLINHDSRRPASAVRVASLRLDVLGVDCGEVYWLVKLDDHVFELWNESVPQRVPVVARLRLPEMDEEQAARCLMLEVASRTAAYDGLGELDEPGLVDRSAWEAIRDAIAARAEAQEGEGPPGILSAAKDLNLAPEAIPGRGPLFRASCVGRNHWFEINPEKGFWYCGYCKCGGTADELIRLVAERRETDSARAPARDLT